MKQNGLEDDKRRYDNLLANVFEEIEDIRWAENHHLPFHTVALLYGEYYLFKAKQLAKKYNWNGRLGKMQSTLTEIRKKMESSINGKLALEYAKNPFS